MKPDAEIRIKTMKITNDNGYICGGDIYYSDLRLYVMKTDSIGNIQWDSSYLGFPATDVIESSNKFYYVVNGNIIRKLDQIGRIVWEIDTNVSALKIIENSNNSLYMLRGNFLSKYDSFGKFYWQIDYFNLFPHSIYFTTMCEDSKGNINMGGYIDYPYTTFTDLFLVKVDTNGKVLNNKIITTGKQDYDIIESITSTNDNGFICTGSTTFEGSRQFWNTIALKTDSMFNTTPIVGIINNNTSLKSDFILYQNYPNPFNPTTTIKFYLQYDSKVKLIIYNITGKLLNTLIDKKLKFGEHEYLFDGKKISSGIYFYSLTIDNKSYIKKMILLK